MALDGNLKKTQNFSDYHKQFNGVAGNSVQILNSMVLMLDVIPSVITDLFTAVTDYMVDDKPFPPMYLEVQTPGDTWVQLNWTVARASLASPLSKHKIYRSDDGGATYPNVYDVTYPHAGGDPTTGPPWVDDNGGAGLTADTDYWYKAVGTNANGDSRYCEPILVHTLP